VHFKSADEDKSVTGKMRHAALLEADGSVGGTEQLSDLAVGGKPPGVTI
jgi:hypothetical protein